MSRFIALLTMVFFAALAQAQASVKASVGGVTLALPVPEDFVDPTEAAPVLKRNAEAITAPPMRLLAVFVNNKDQTAVQQGMPPSFKRYFMVQVLRSREADTVNLQAFPEVKAQVTGIDPAAFSKVIGDVQKHVGTAAKKIGSDAGIGDLNLDIGVPKQLGIFDETESSVSMLLVTRVSTASSKGVIEKVMGQATSTVLLRGKVVLFGAFSEVNDGSDYEWLRSVSQAWVKAALVANRQ